VSTAPPEGRGRRRSLSVVVPALNEEDVIGETVDAVAEYLGAHFEESELLVVDDGSRDATAELVTARADGERVRLLQHADRRGKGAAVRTGVLASRGEQVLFMDADHSMSIAEVERLWGLLDDAEIAIASKRAPGVQLDYPWSRRLGGALGQALVRLCVVPGITDTQGGFKLFRGDVARSLFRAQQLDGFGFDFEVLYLARRFGWRVAEAPFRGRHRTQGSVSRASYLATLADVGRVVAGRLGGRYPLEPPPGAPDRSAGGSD